MQTCPRHSTVHDVETCLLLDEPEHGAMGRSNRDMLAPSWRFLYLRKAP
jgi:hypothetical protein